MTDNCTFTPVSADTLQAVSGIRAAVYDSITSTNSALVASIRAGDASPRIFAAQRQTGGRGRLGRSFSSQYGGVYFSFNLTLPVTEAYKTVLITPLSGVAAATAIFELYGADVRLKWVNDLIIGDKKLGGILSESLIIGDDIHIVVGIGINVTNDDFPDVATSLCRHTSASFDANEIIARIVGEFHKRLPRIDIIADEYRALLCHLGMPVTVHTFDGSDDYAAVAVDVTDDCRLIISVGGELRHLSSGEVSVRFQKEK